MEGLNFFATGILSLLTPGGMIIVLWATLLGIVVGMLPGLTATVGLALMTSLTFRFPAEQAILVLLCMYVGAIYGGSRSAILLNMPGTPANAATTLDGYPLARAGQAARAMGTATTGSVMGTFVGMIILATFAPYLVEVALKFHSYEYFWLAVLGVVVSGQLTAPEDPLKGWISGTLGLLIAMIGLDGMHAEQRFVFGYAELSGGIGIIPAMVGAFGYAEIISVMSAGNIPVIKDTSGSAMPKLSELIRYRYTVVRSGILGTVMGLIPGVGEDMGAWLSYTAARRTSREKTKFGQGSVEGLLAAETGNSSAVPGAIIPVLTLAIPGSAATAALLAALYIHGVRPGPMMMVETPAYIYQIVAMIFLASVAILVYGVLLTKPLVAVLSVPRARLMPVIFVLCTIGAFGVAGRYFDIWVMLCFGVLGYVLRTMHYPVAPLILGLVLGDILDKNLRRGLILSDGDLTPFVSRPISFVLFISVIAIIVYRLLPKRRTNP